MRIQELVIKLQQQEERHGNVEVKHEDGGKHYVILDVSPSFYKGQAEYILIY